MGGDLAGERDVFFEEDGGEIVGVAAIAVAVFGAVVAGETGGGKKDGVFLAVFA